MAIVAIPNVTTRFQLVLTCTRDITCDMCHIFGSLFCSLSTETARRTNFSTIQLWLPISSPGIYKCTMTHYPESDIIPSYDDTSNAFTLVGLTLSMDASRMWHWMNSHVCNDVLGSRPIVLCSPSPKPDKARKGWWVVALGRSRNPPNLHWHFKW